MTNWDKQQRIEVNAMFHLHNGDSTADTLRRAGFPGTHFAFREALTSGPTPQGLAKEEWFAVRARALAGMATQTVATVEQELAAQDATLDSLNRHDEIVLWFEHDLLCQTHLIYLLDRFARQPVAPARLSLICINEFPGIPDFRGLGQLTAEQMASLFDTRHEITAAEFNCARSAWHAYSSDDPHVLNNLLQANLSALPFLRGALLQHAARFPSYRNGLSYAENRLLGLIVEGFTDYPKLCSAFFAAEPAYGLGDLQIQQDLKRMAEVRHPLIALSVTGDWRNATCRLIDHGRRILENRDDFVALNSLDQWLGGVHLTNEYLWRWDGKTLKRS
jgi:hypothetical protein